MPGRHCRQSDERRTGCFGKPGQNGVVAVDHRDADLFASASQGPGGVSATILENTKTWVSIGGLIYCGRAYL
jgi:hypothetical protein